MIPGLSGAGILRGARSMFSGANMYKAGRFLGSNRTAVGAGIGALYGASGDNGSFGGAMMGAAAGAGIARYGVNFAKGLRGVRGMGLAGGALTTIGAGMRTAGFMRHDARRLAAFAGAQGRAAGKFIAAGAVRANAGYGRIRSNVSNKFRFNLGGGMAY